MPELRRDHGLLFKVRGRNDMAPLDLLHIELEPLSLDQVVIHWNVRKSGRTICGR